MTPLTSPLVLVLESSTICVVPASGAPFVIPWTPNDATAAAQTITSRSPAGSGVILVVGLALLEVARPALPPVVRREQLQMLRQAPDRYFALEGSAAVASDGPVAFAMRSATLASWTQAFAALGTVVGVVTIAQAAVWSGTAGTVALDAGEAAHGLLTIEGGQVHDARRTRGVSAAGHPPLDVAQIARAAVRVTNEPLEAQLLDAPLKAQLHRSRTQRDVQSMALFVAAALVLAVAADWRAERRLTALESEVRRLEPLAVPAREALARLQRAGDEQRALEQLAAAAASPAAPDAVIARVSERLPADAFVQRLTWEGASWRIDGSARDAAALVPLLLADSLLVNVQSAAPSTRYLDGGVPRSSFSLTFAPAEGARGAR